MSKAAGNKSFIGKKYEHEKLSAAEESPIEIRVQYEHYGTVEFQKNKEETKHFNIVFYLEKNSPLASAPHLLKVNIDVEVDPPKEEKVDL